MKRGEERDCYTLLREQCGFTHFGVRTVVLAFMPSPRWKRALEKERAVFIKSMDSDIDSLALQCMREDPATSARAIINLVWSDRSQQPAVCWAIVSETARRIGKAMDYDKVQTRRMRDKLRFFREWESKQAKKRWTANHIATYLVLKGFLSPRVL